MQSIDFTTRPTRRHYDIRRCPNCGRYGYQFSAGLIIHATVNDAVVDECDIAAQHNMREEG